MGEDLSGRVRHQPWGRIEDELAELVPAEQLRLWGNNSAKK